MARGAWGAAKHDSAHRSGRPAGGFSRDVRPVSRAPVQAPRRATRPLVYSPPSGRFEVPSAVPAVPTPKESTTPAPTPQLAQNWASIRSELRRAVPDSTFEIWL